MFFIKYQDPKILTFFYKKYLKHNYFLNHSYSLPLRIIIVVVKLVVKIVVVKTVVKVVVVKIEVEILV